MTRQDKGSRLAEFTVGAVLERAFIQAADDLQALLRQACSREDRQKAVELHATYQTLRRELDNDDLYLLRTADDTDSETCELVTPDGQEDVEELVLVNLRDLPDGLFAQFYSNVLSLRTACRTGRGEDDFRQLARSFWDKARELLTTNEKDGEAG